MEALFERVFVETTVDTDQDGQYDLIALYIKRPKLDEKFRLFLWPIHICCTVMRIGMICMM